MNISGHILDITYQVSQVPPSSYPSILWRLYIEYLWNYQPNSWVARTGSTARVLAIIFSLPIVILALLDIASYSIARTLGVIDDVKASTSDTSTLYQHKDVPAISIHKSVIPSSASSLTSNHELPASHSTQIDESTQHSRSTSDCPDSGDYLGALQSHAFYASEENDLKLSGVGVFSPAASQPPSPTISRKNLNLEKKPCIFQG